MVLLDDPYNLSRWLILAARARSRATLCFGDRSALEDDLVHKRTATVL